MKQYNPNEVSINFAGVPFDGGYADGEFITVEWESDMVQDVVGTDGEVTASLNKDMRATVTLKLMQSSAAHAAMIALYNLRKNGKGTIGVGPFMLRDRIAKEQVVAPDAWIMKAPDISYDRTAQSREWKIRLANAELILA